MKVTMTWKYMGLMAIFTGLQAISWPMNPGSSWNMIIKRAVYLSKSITLIIPLWISGCFPMPMIIKFPRQYRSHRERQGEWNGCLQIAGTGTTSLSDREKSICTALPEEWKPESTASAIRQWQRISDWYFQQKGWFFINPPPAGGGAPTFAAGQK